MHPPIHPPIQSYTLYKHSTLTVLPIQTSVETSKYMSLVSSVFHTEITVNIGLKNTVRVITSISSIRCIKHCLTPVKVFYMGTLC